jgi:hypothetical protein
MEYKSDDFGVSFTVADKVTVRRQLIYFSEAARATGKELFERLWLGARTVIEDWQCEAMPDIDTDLDSLTDPRAAAAVTWAGIQVQNHMDGLERIPKN